MWSRRLNMATFDYWDLLSSGDKREFFFVPWVIATPPFRDLKVFCGLMIAVNVLSSSCVLYFVLFPILPHAGTFQWFSIYSASVSFAAWTENRMVLVTNMDKLSPGQTIATCQRNISQHCWAQHVACVWPPYCDVLRHVGCCWLKFENGQIWANNTQHVATHRNTVAKRMQHVAPNSVAICCVDMLRSFGRAFTFVKLEVWSQISLI